MDWAVIRGTKDLAASKDLQDAFLATALAVRRIIDSRLWVDEFATFADFASSRGVPKSRIYQIGNCAATLLVRPVLDTHARPSAPHPPPILMAGMLAFSVTSRFPP